MRSLSCGRSITAAIALWLLGACSTWQVQDVTPQALLETRSPDVIQVTRMDSTRIELRVPRLMGDTIVGARNGQFERVALADVLAVAVRTGGGGGTVVPVAAGFGLVLLILSTDTSYDFDSLSIGCSRTPGSSSVC